MQAINITHDFFSSSSGLKFHKLTEHAAECVSLVSSNILSYKHWYYLKNGPKLPWFTPNWLKTQALKSALSIVNIAKKNANFLNQLLSLAVFEYSTLPCISQNLMKVSLLYCTLF